jgi:hypothetical protein
VGLIYGKKQHLRPFAPPYATKQDCRKVGAGFQLKILRNQRRLSRVALVSPTQPCLAVVYPICISGDTPIYFTLFVLVAGLWQSIEAERDVSAE